MGCKRWTREEVEIIENYYKKGGLDLCRKKGLTRSVKSIRSKARDLTLTNPNYRKVAEVWTDEEIELLKKYYPIGGFMLCREKGLNKGDYCICYKAKALKVYIGKGKGINRNNWTDEEIDILKKYYTIGGVNLCKEKGLNRSEGSIYIKVSKLNITKNAWTKEYIDILKKYYPLGGVMVCQEMGLNFSRYRIVNRAKKLGLEYKK